jgi:hypothetical protein
MNHQKLKHVMNDTGFSIARIGATDEEPGKPVFVSLGINAYVGSFLTVKEAEQICIELQAAILSARGVSDASHVYGAEHDQG